MPRHILHVISKIPPSLASTCQVTSHTSYQKSHPLWQVHAKSHLTRHIKIPPSLASTCQVTSYTSYQKSHPLWQVHAKPHLTRHIKYPTLSGKYMPSHTLHVISEIPTSLASTCLWQPPPSRQMTWGRTEKNHEKTSWSDPLIDGRSVVHEAWFPTCGGWIIVYE